jgi:hypothetical protein
MSVFGPMSLRWSFLTPPDVTLLDDDVVVEAATIDLDLAERNEPTLHGGPRDESSHGLTG